MSSTVTPSPAPPVAPAPRRPRSFAGPLVLILIGLVFMLRNFNVLSTAAMFHWFARYWPVLIIVWGLVKLLEYYQAQRAGYPPRGVGAGGVVLLVFLILFGLAASEGERVNWGRVGSEMDIDEDVFSNVFGQTYTYTGEVEQAFPKNVSSVHVVSDRGDVNVQAWDQDKIKVSYNKSVGAANESDAKQVDNQTKPQITIAGDTLTVNANTGGAGDKPVKNNLEIFIPRRAALDLALKRGDVTVRERTGDVKASTTHGDVSLDNVRGNTSLNVRRGSVTVSKVTGDLSVEGRIDDTTVSDVSGSVRFSGDFFGTVSLSRAGKGVSFKSSRTDLEFAKLAGEFNMQRDELHASGASGPLHVLTRAKEIHLEDVSGDVRIENSNADVEIRASRVPLGNIQVENHRGRVALVVPARAGFQLDARTSRGEVQSDFDVKIETAGREAHATGQVGGGGPSVRLNTDRADIEIRKAG
ncbi:MAG TPA: DUF4097 family beta strand repeat-containing protein [Terriglobales bacterium]|nr:DUF4097 family beta strand repeat-containing protein [Terriglobales bacterium]